LFSNFIKICSLILLKVGQKQHPWGGKYCTREIGSESSSRGSLAV